MKSVHCVLKSDDRGHISCWNGLQGANRIFPSLAPSIQQMSPLECSSPEVDPKMDINTQYTSLPVRVRPSLHEAKLDRRLTQTYSIDDLLLPTFPSSLCRCAIRLTATGHTSVHTIFCSGDPLDLYCLYSLRTMATSLLCRFVYRVRHVRGEGSSRFFRLLTCCASSTLLLLRT